jgi:hypothetical protein
MRLLGWFVSVLAHLAFVLAGFIVWPREIKPLEADSAVVPVEVVTFAERANVAPIAPPTPSAAEAPEEKGAPQPAETSPSEPTEAVPEKKPEPKPKADKPKAFDFDKLALLIDRAKKTPGRKEAAAAPSAKPGDKPRRGFGAQDGLATTERDALKAQLQKCWRAPVDLPHPERLIVRVHISLTRQGALASEPQLVSAVAIGDSAMRVAAENALRAVRLCAPFTLPTETYDRWREVNFTFDPREMSEQ